MAEQDGAAQVRAMRSVRDFERLKAAGALEEMTRGTVGALVCTYRREFQKRLWYCAASCTISISAILGAQAIMDPYAKQSLASWWTDLISLAVVGSGVLFVRETALQARVVSVLSGCADVRLLGELAEALDYQETRARAVVTRALVNVLPLVGADDGAFFSDRHRKHLAASLGVGSPELAAATLGAMARLGDASCLKQVKRLAEGKGLARRRPALRVAANEALPLLNAARERTKAEATLLRPAEAPADATLLRPAGSPAAGDETMLLRPAAPAEGDDAEVTSTHA